MTPTAGRVTTSRYPSRLGRVRAELPLPRRWCLLRLATRLRRCKRRRPSPTRVHSAVSVLGFHRGLFGCFENPNTGLTPFEAQGVTYELADTVPGGTGQPINITGYGVDSSPNEWNQIQQSHTGPYAGNSGTTIQYSTDTQGGNSGSGVLDESTGLAIGIHTHGGCGAGGGANSGTAVQHSGLQNALANPQGVCIPSAPIALPSPTDCPN